MPKTVRIVSLDVALTCLVDVLGIVDAWIKEKSSRYICVSNVHMCMEAYDDADFQTIVNGADLVVPDGKPLVWAQKLLGNKGAKQVRGQDLMEALCELSLQNKFKVGIFGGKDISVLQSVKVNLSKIYPGIAISYEHSPPFRSLTEEEDAALVLSINESEVDVLFVGVGCPKQERWMAEHKDQLGCVMIGVGAAFDFISGRKRHAPSWMRSIGLEWLFRLFSEPRRLWKRYLKHNPRFVFYLFFQLLGKKYN